MDSDLGREYASFVLNGLNSRQYPVWGIRLGKSLSRAVLSTPFLGSLVLCLNSSLFNASLPASSDVIEHTTHDRFRRLSYHPSARHTKHLADCSNQVRFRNARREAFVSVGGYTSIFIEYEATFLIVIRTLDTPTTYLHEIIKMEYQPTADLGAPETLQSRQQDLSARAKGAYQEGIQHLGDLKRKRTEAEMQLLAAEKHGEQTRAMVLESLLKSENSRCSLQQVGAVTAATYRDVELVEETQVWDLHAVALSHCN